MASLNLKTGRWCEWVKCICNKLDLMRNCVALKTAVANESRVKFVNKGSKMSEFAVGHKVLYRLPG